MLTPAGARRALDQGLLGQGALHVGLHTAVPTADNELTGNAYARVAVAPAGWTFANGAANTAAIEFPTPTGAWSDPTHIGLWESARPSAAGYLVNKASGYAVGDTAIAVDTGTGTIPDGSRVTFAGHGTAYTVEAFAGGSLTLADGLTVAVADDAAVTVTTGPLLAWTALTGDAAAPSMDDNVSIDAGELTASTPGTSLFDAAVGAAGVVWAQAFAALFPTPNPHRFQLVSSLNFASFPAFDAGAGLTRYVRYLAIAGGADLVVLINLTDTTVPPADVSADLPPAAEQSYHIAFRDRTGGAAWDFAFADDKSTPLSDPYEMPATPATLDAIQAVIDGGGTLDVIIYDLTAAATLTARLRVRHPAAIRSGPHGRLAAGALSEIPRRHTAGGSRRAPATIRTLDGDVLDEICWRRYGREDAVPAVLAANPGLADQPPILPAGIAIVLPPLPAAEPSPAAVRLWGDQPPNE